MIRQERYAGSMQRSFFVGQDVTEDEIKAKFEDGVLKLAPYRRRTAAEGYRPKDHSYRGLMQSNQFLSRSPVLCILSNIPTDDRLGGRRNLGKQ